MRAFAKINPTLHVVGRRDDGYHDLNVTFQSLALHDTIVFTPARGPFTIVCDEPSVPSDRTNLIWRAAAALWRVARRRGSPPNVRVDLVKRIPTQAGLGGGSSNAAATLRALDSLWRTELDPDALHGIAASLGADVPYFLTGGSALGLDRGDRVFALPDWPSVWVTLVQPSFGVSTREAYAWLDRDRRMNRNRRSSTRNGWAALGWRLPPHEAGNDFERSVSRRHPAIARLIRGLERCGAVHAAMSGSGSAVFGVFRSRAAAETAALAMAAPRQPAIVTRTIGRREYAHRARPLRQGLRAV